jgi:hypothetical protein
MLRFLVDGDRDLEDPTDRSHAGLFRGFILRNSDVGAAALTLDVFFYRAICGLPYIIWGFEHVAGFRRRHIGASIHGAWTESLDSVRTALDANPADDRTVILRATAQELWPPTTSVLTPSARRPAHVSFSSTQPSSPGSGASAASRSTCSRRPTPSSLD